jgi:ABC-type Zn uptake system ZnuABC Zn-binding protein ZnuA
MSLVKKFILLIGCLGLWGCTKQESGSEIVTSFSVLCNLVEQLGEETRCLIRPDRDPHTYEGTPQDRQEIETAGIIFYGGLNFEPSIIKMVEATNSKGVKVPTFERANIKIVENDPHVWHDVKNGIELLELITEILKQNKPDRAEFYEQNRQKLTKELEQLDRWIKVQIDTIPPDQRRLVTTHDAFSYYSRAYGLKVEGTLLGFSTEEEPTAKQVKNLIDRVKKSGILTIFAELTSNDKVLRNIAKEAGVKISDRVLIADGIGKSGTPEGSYQGMLIYNTCTIVAGLGGKCSPFPN